MAQITATFETGVNGNTIATTDPGSATAWDLVTIGASSTVTYSNTQKYDTLSGKIVVAGGNVTFLTWSTAFGTQTDHYGRLYLYITAWPTATRIVQTTRSGGTACAYLDINNTGLLLLKDSTFATKATSTTAITKNQWVRLEWHIIHSATVGQIEAKIFLNADSSIADETVTSAANLNTLVNSDTINFGQAVSGNNNTMYLDNIIAGAASYPGPVSSGAVASPSAQGTSNYYYYS